MERHGPDNKTARMLCLSRGEEGKENSETRGHYNKHCKRIKCQAPGNIPGAAEAACGEQLGALGRASGAGARPREGHSADLSVSASAQSCLRQASCEGSMVVHFVWPDG